MSRQYPLGLKANLTSGARVEAVTPGTWRLEIPSGLQGHYRVAQLDDYHGLPRRGFRWQTPFRLSLEARASAAHIPGTWGVGLWNDPFGMAIIGGHKGLYLPALPNAAWFFFASPPNYLSLRDDLPALGGLAATFRSPRWPLAFLAPLAVGLPLVFWPAAVRWLRRLARRFVRQDAAALPLDPCAWHAYEMAWEAGQVRFWVDGQEVLNTPLSPQGPLGLVIWVDNQYAALPPTGRLGYGTLPNPQAAWIEIRNMAVKALWDLP